MVKKHNDVLFLERSIIDVTAPKKRGAPGDLYGLELEMEGRNIILNPGTYPGWDAHEDGSLRNNHGQAIEYVLRQPLTFTKCNEKLDKLFDSLTKNGAEIYPSNRTSTHVHFNMADKKVYQLVNIFVLYSIVEHVFHEYCGEQRYGNLFCLGNSHAPYVFHVFNQSMFRYRNFLEFRDALRYSGLNLAALNKFCSVEFRTLGGVDTAEKAKEWLSIINDLCEYACYTMDTPTSLIESFSMKGPEGLLYEVFSKENAEKLLAKVEDKHLMQEKMYEGVRNVQILSYRVSDKYNEIVKHVKDFWAEKAVIKEEPEPVLFLPEADDVEPPFRRALRRGWREPAEVVAPVNANWADLDERAIADQRELERRRAEEIRQAMQQARPEVRANREWGFLPHPGPQQAPEAFEPLNEEDF